MLKNKNILAKINMNKVNDKKKYRPNYILSRPK